MSQILFSPLSKTLLVVAPPLGNPKNNLIVKCPVVRSSIFVIDGGAALKCYFSAPPAPVRKGCKYYASGVLTLERSNLYLSQQQQQQQPPELEVDNIWGDIGNINNVGGGNGGDDDYFNDFNENEDGEEGRQFRRRMVDSVLKEWNKTIEELPAGLRQAHEMGLVSSPEMLKHLAATHASRPTTMIRFIITRFIYRALTLGISRLFNDRLVQAGPAFLYRLLLVEVASVWWEVKNRKYMLSVTTPPYANLRYKLLRGFDQALFFSTALRVLKGERSRLASLGGGGVEVDPMAQSAELLKSYKRPFVDGSRSSSKWFLFKNAIVGLLGIRQGNAESAADGETEGSKGPEIEDC